MVFSDKKKSNLDGSDGSQCYWHDLRNEKQLFSKIPFEGWSITVGGTFSTSGKADLLAMDGKQNSTFFSKRFVKIFSASI